MGPVEYFVVEFPGNQFKGEIVPALKELVKNQTIHIIDLVFIRKELDSSYDVLELSALPAEEAAAFDDLDGDIEGLFSEEDIRWAAGKLQPNSSAAVLVFEHAWAERLIEAAKNAGGRLVLNDRVPADVVAAALDAANA
jgi:hypothetical protein